MDEISEADKLIEKDLSYNAAIRDNWLLIISSVATGFAIAHSKYFATHLSMYIGGVWSFVVCILFVMVSFTCTDTCLKALGEGRQDKAKLLDKLNSLCNYLALIFFIAGMILIAVCFSASF